MHPSMNPVDFNFFNKQRRRAKSLMFSLERGDIDLARDILNDINECIKEYVSADEMLKYEMDFYSEDWNSVEENPDNT